MHNADILHEALTKATMISRKGKRNTVMFAVIEYDAKWESLRFKPLRDKHDNNADVETLMELCDDDSLRVFTELATDL